ncbi:MAG TPA: gamma-glutamyl-gamma-aminobutyrate hydrolase family protein, partial [Gammaproteobacteria bacterium]|nr:gamma-glutamyl-gamma-aminobutyrate hydrolase family protein [Gammaproteobacteria bacterium]
MSQRDIHAERILIIDFGSQWTQLIARRVREIGVYCEVRTPDLEAAALKSFGPRGVILSGGPESVVGDATPKTPRAVFELGVPVLGICYGMQDMAAQLGGKVLPGTHSEFGVERMTLTA